MIWGFLAKFFVQLLIGVAISIAAYALRSKPKQPKPPAARDLQNPTAEASRPIPTVFGTLLVKSPNVLAFGDKYKNDRGNGRADYYLSVLYGICYGEVDYLLNIKVKGKWVFGGNFGAWSKKTRSSALRASIVGNKLVSVETPFSSRINNPNLFGGNDEEGGLVGDFNFWTGWNPVNVEISSPNNSFITIHSGVNRPLQAFLSRLRQEILRVDPSVDTDFFSDTYTDPPFLGVPAMRGISCALFENSSSGGFLWGSNSPVLPGVQFLVARSAAPGWKADKAKIARQGNIFDANPAHMIREILTDEVWGMGLDPDEGIDEDSFAAAADALFSEYDGLGFGLSMGWFDQSTIEDFVGEILDHIDASLYVDPASGKFKMKLWRGDYDPLSTELPHLTESNSKIIMHKRKAVNEIVNSIHFTWTRLAPDTGDDEETSFTVHDLAALQTFGQEVSADRNMYGITNEALARRVANRELRKASALTASGRVEAHRFAVALSPGDVFRLSSEFHGIDGKIMRVTKINKGAPGRSRVVIEYVEDIFALHAPSLSDITQGENLGG